MHKSDNMGLKINSNRLLNIILEEIINSLCSNVDYRLDEMSVSTLLNEKSLLLKEDTNNDLNKIKRFALKKKNYDINDYKGFVDSVSKTNDDLKGFLSDHPVEELQQGQWKTFKLKGYNAGFALHFLGGGRVDICNLHNNSGIKGLGNVLLQFAKIQGGTQMDNFGKTSNGKNFLGDKYQKQGFGLYDKFTWDDQYAPSNWNYEKFGRPDVEMRRRQKHTNKFNQGGSYRDSFNKYIGKQFPDVDVNKDYD
jgi:hypothetical protein